MIFNATQHDPSPSQVGVGPASPAISKLITFDEIPTRLEMIERAEGVVKELKAQGATHDSQVMIGGAPYFQSTLELVLLQNGLKPLYAFSKRVSTDAVQPDGSIKKVAIFVHEGWIPSTLTGTEHDPYAHEPAWEL